MIEESQLCDIKNAAWFEFNNGYLPIKKVGTAKIEQICVYTVG